jgi:hypothetical protein
VVRGGHRNAGAGAAAIARIEAETGLPVLAFPKEREFFVELAPPDAGGPMALDDFDRALIAATQGGLPLVPRPTTPWAPCWASGEQVRERLAQMLESGLIRRIGAVPNHYRLGFTANGMSVWDVDDAQVDSSASASASCPA